jgi:hypothetical protein
LLCPWELEPTPFVLMTLEGIAIVPIIGTLVSRSGFVDAPTGLPYGDIGHVIAGAMADPAVRGVMLDMNSPVWRRLSSSSPAVEASSVACRPFMAASSPPKKSHDWLSAFTASDDAVANVTAELWNVSPLRP